MVGVTTALPAGLSSVPVSPVMVRDSAPVVTHSSTALLPSAMVVGLAVKPLTTPAPVTATVTATLLVTVLPERLAVRV